MELLGQTFTVANNAGWYGLLSLLFLLLLYLMKPKPFKKVIPSIIFLEVQKKRSTVVFLLRRIIMDWLVLLQILVLVLLCMAALQVNAEIYFKRINRDVIFVIDASASSQAYYEGKQLIEHYKDIAKRNIGIANSIVLVKSTPEISVIGTNPLNAYASISSIRATESLSNIWDAIMVASDLAKPRSKIIVLSDFADTGERDLGVAKKLLEAKSQNVEMINPRKQVLSNIGIIKFALSGGNIVADVKNFDPFEREITVKNTKEKIMIPAYSVAQFSVQAAEGLNKIEIETEDSFSPDDTLFVIIPKKSDISVLYISSGHSTFLRKALESIKHLKITSAKPPVIPSGEYSLFVLDELDYKSLLPGTVDSIKSQVNAGASIIIAAQEGMDYELLGDLLPVTISGISEQQAEILDRSSLARFRDFNYGLSSRYFTASLSANESIVIAEASDRDASPAIVLSNYGRGKILFYGIFDDSNQFKTSTDYPLFWINAIDYLASKKDYKEINLASGNIIYGRDIKEPGGNRLGRYAIAERIGIYRVDDREIAVNLLNVIESDINRGDIFQTGENQQASERVMQPINLASMFIIVAILVIFVELYFLKRRGDL